MQFIFKVMLVFIVAILSACERHEEKALIADENWTQGQLENGLRYHIYPTNDEEVSVRMLVHVGSLQENDNQKGYAHFVEHMAFNGTRNFSGNDIIQLVEKSGKSFGRDINAFTAYQLTHYQLDLASAADLTMALTWMRDVGDGIEFDPQQVESEKGVILGEFRLSRLENKSLFEQSYLNLIKSTRLNMPTRLALRCRLKQQQRMD
ncbi:M16 family metallopeptidase [Vibrio taketomensis]|uniref:M16 family metallopeptidase n=1 Tax=Vibrio taketomensis TaxID=2572923 RepID=UPI001E48C062|nr:insulinase family protein [Vibrio taketomensis]